MAIETVLTCPLGSECETVKNNKLHRCMWYTNVVGRNPQTGEDIDEWRCAMSWIPVLLVENAMTNRGQTAAIESFRNEVVSQSEQTNQIMLTAAQMAAQQRTLLSNNS